MSLKKRTDLLIVNPGRQEEIYQSLARDLTAFEPPVWAGSIAKYIRGQGLSVEFIDANAEGLSPSAVAREAAGLNPTLVAVVVYGHQPSASTQNMPAAGAICSEIKRSAPELKVILIGGHVAALPEKTMREEDADFVCDGEGLYTIEKLIHTLKADGMGKYTDVPGLWYVEGSTICSTHSAPLIKDLDQDFSGLAWDLLPMDKYRAHNWHCFGEPSRKPYASIYTGLGCPFRCTFCCINAPFGKPGYRCRSPQNVVEEIDLLVREYGVRNIKIADELFVLNERHVSEICDLLIERRYDLNIWAYARVDTVGKPGLLDKLRAAGVRWLALGIESGNERVLHDVQKDTKEDDIFRAVKDVHQAGIYIIGNYLLGLPEDDLDSMKQTMSLAKTLNCEFANIYCAMAYPGSSLYHTALEKGWPLPESFTGYSQHAYDTLPLPTNYLAGPEVLRFRDLAFNDYYTNPDYLESIKSKFGETAVEEVRQMLKKELPRKYVP